MMRALLAILALAACAPSAARPDAGAACMTAAERAELLDQVAALQARLDRHAAAQAEVLATVAESKADNVWWQRGRGPTRPCPPLPTATTLRGGRTP